MILFTNRRNDCYINAVLQALLNIPAFTYYFTTRGINNNNINNMFRVIISENKLTSPKNIKMMLSQVNDNSFRVFGNDDQQDAHEAIVLILDIVHLAAAYRETDFGDYGEIDSEIDSMKRKSFASWRDSAEKDGYSFITKFFTGQFKTTILCKSCKKYKNVTFTNFNNISVQLVGNDISDCFSDFIKPEKLEGAICELCKKETLINVMTIWKFPSILIVNLKRFTSDRFGNVRRCGQIIELEPTLHFNSSGIDYIYKLISVVYHLGSTPKSGHYITHILQNDIWYIVDDELKYPKELEASSNAYILIYEITST